MTTSAQYVLISALKTTYVVNLARFNCTCFSRSSSNRASHELMRISSARVSLCGLTWASLALDLALFFSPHSQDNLFDKVLKGASFQSRGLLGLRSPHANNYLDLEVQIFNSEKGKCVARNPHVPSLEFSEAHSSKTHGQEPFPNPKHPAHRQVTCS